MQKIFLDHETGRSIDDVVLEGSNGIFFTAQADGFIIGKFPRCNNCDLIRLRDGVAWGAGPFVNMREALEIPGNITNIYLYESSLELAELIQKYCKK